MLSDKAFCSCALWHSGWCNYGKFDTAI